MKSKWQRLALVLTVTLSTVLVFSSVEAKTYRFKFAHGAPPAMAQVEVGLWIVDRLNKETNGQIKASYFHSGKMGGEVEMFEKLSKGILQGASISFAVTSNYGPKINIMNLPFMFPSTEAMTEFRKSPLFDEVMHGLDKYGIVGLGSAYFGWASLAMTKPIGTFDDLQQASIKYRVPKSKIMMDYCVAMGLKPTPIPFPEVYSSLQQGVIDGLEATPETIKLVKFDEVLKSIYLTRHFYGGQGWWVRQDFLDSLPNDLRIQFIRIVQEELEKSITKAIKNDKMALSAFNAKGMKLFEMTPADRAKFEKAVQPVWEEYADIIGRDYFNKVKEFFRNKK